MSFPSLAQQARLTPPTPDRTRRDSVTSERATKSPPSKMLKIHDLLNPEGLNCGEEASASASSTPASTGGPSTPSSTPYPETPLSSNLRGEKFTKHAYTFVRNPPQGQVNYPPFELSEESTLLTPSQSAELRQQHKIFQLAPSVDDGLIKDYVKHIPYASEKKGFFGKTGRAAFEIFQYIFVVPNDPQQSIRHVMWDYQNGLVRITPFFKACGFTKTTPAKALSSNPGLKDLAHSITGGSLLAQGYWVPYSCARAICLTFCHPIRWALTPIFGHSFIKDCLPPTHPGYQRFKISPEVIRIAQMEAEGWKLQASRSATPNSPATYGTGEVPRSLPPTSAPAASMELRPRNEKPTFKLGSPFSPDTGSSYRYNRRASSVGQDGTCSPKSSPTPALPRITSGWTSINGPNQYSTPSPQKNSMTPTGDASRPFGLLTEPYINSIEQQSSWRGMDGKRSASPTLNNPALRELLPRKAHQHKNLARKRDHELDEDDASQGSSNSPASGKQSESAVSPLPAPVKLKVKRLRRQASDEDMASGLSSDGRNLDREQVKTKKFTSVEARAAHLLVILSQEDKNVPDEGLDEE